MQFKIHTHTLYTSTQVKHTSFSQGMLVHSPQNDKSNKYIHLKWTENIANPLRYNSTVHSVYSAE